MKLAIKKEKIQKSHRQKPLNPASEAENEKAQPQNFPQLPTTTGFDPKNENNISVPALLPRERNCEFMPNQAASRIEASPQFYPEKTGDSAKTLPTGANFKPRSTQIGPIRARKSNQKKNFLQKIQHTRLLKLEISHLKKTFLQKKDIPQNEKKLWLSKSRKLENNLRSLRLANIQAKRNQKLDKLRQQIMNHKMEMQLFRECKQAAIVFDSREELIDLLMKRKKEKDPEFLSYESDHYFPPKVQQPRPPTNTTSTANTSLVTAAASRANRPAIRKLRRSVAIRTKTKNSELKPSKWSELAARRKTIRMQKIRTVQKNAIVDRIERAVFNRAPNSKPPATRAQFLKEVRDKAIFYLRNSRKLTQNHQIGESGRAPRSFTRGQNPQTPVRPKTRTPKPKPSYRPQWNYGIGNPTVKRKQTWKAPRTQAPSSTLPRDARNPGNTAFRVERMTSQSNRRGHNLNQVARINQHGQRKKGNTSVEEVFVLIKNLIQGVVLLCSRGYLTLNL